MGDHKSSDKTVKNAEIKLQKILNKIENLRLSDSYVSSLHRPRKGRVFNFTGNFGWNWMTKSIIFVVISVFSAWWINKEVFADNCDAAGNRLGPTRTQQALFRPPEDCTMCVGVDNVVRIANVSPALFELEYAYGTVPVIVTDAMKDWRAIQEFNFTFFADFYTHLKSSEKFGSCFYYPYKSGLNSLHEVFNMDEKRANLSGEPWYVGWSTCTFEEAERLRAYYNRPYFLPKTSESLPVDWIFMGGPGQGAHMHVDTVRYISWQAQVRGRKQWQLAPPPECLYRCRWFSFTVEPGETLVLDTNRWYHKTSVLPGDISITIGAEYD
ncbi:uncharacterized protein LOC128671096 [Plodia interpunctella]|uniref:uncharacterized protein LOC128671096 n=1 Tax=Plodia interpunctella TaxID=58824 RepID=UPI002368ABF2|nr:uncharacterized protein LOC128671096 [Plodia interpunctella]